MTLPAVAVTVEVDRGKTGVGRFDGGGGIFKGGGRGICA
jgi:hypothetical protein